MKILTSGLNSSLYSSTGTFILLDFNKISACCNKIDFFVFKTKLVECGFTYVFENFFYNFYVKKCPDPKNFCAMFNAYLSVLSSPQAFSLNTYCNYSSSPVKPKCSRPVHFSIHLEIVAQPKVRQSGRFPTLQRII
jgi:hypothetical protein